MGMEAGPRLPPRQDGGILIILGMPVGTELSIDLQGYQVGPEFKGIAGIPLGRLHLVTCGTGQGLRQGFFLRFTHPREVVVKSWDAAEEELVEEGTGLPEGSMESLLRALQRGELNRHLGAYPEAEQGRLWRNLTNCVEEGTLAHCGLRLGQRVLAGEWEEEKLPRAGAAGAEGGAGGAVVPFFPGLGRAAHFTDVPGARRPTHRAMTPEELTRYHLDRSERLEVLLREAYGNGGGDNAGGDGDGDGDGAWRRFLGEYQLAFVLFLNLYSMAGLRHWKEATALLCHCGPQALGRHPALFRAFLRVLFTQVKTIPEDFFVEEDQLSRGNFLQPCLRALVRNVRDYCREQPGGEAGMEGGAVVDLKDEEEEEEEQDDNDLGGIGSGGSVDAARELGRYVDRFAALMERRFRGLALGRAANKAAGAAGAGRRDRNAEAGEEDEEEEEEEDDEDGPVVVPWEEVARALEEADLAGGEEEGPAAAPPGAAAAGAMLSAIQEEDPTAV